MLNIMGVWLVKEIVRRRLQYFIVDATADDSMLSCHRLAFALLSASGPGVRGWRRSGLWPMDGSPRDGSRTQPLVPVCNAAGGDCIVHNRSCPAMADALRSSGLRPPTWADRGLGKEALFMRCRPKARVSIDVRWHSLARSIYNQIRGAGKAWDRRGCPEGVAFAIAVVVHTAAQVGRCVGRACRLSVDGVRLRRGLGATLSPHVRACT